MVLWLDFITVATRTKFFVTRCLGNTDTLSDLPALYRLLRPVSYLASNVSLTFTVHLAVNSFRLKEEFISVCGHMPGSDICAVAPFLSSLCSEVHWKHVCYVMCRTALNGPFGLESLDAKNCKAFVWTVWKATF